MKYFADPQLRILDNGIPVSVVERPEQPAAEILACVRTGSIHEAEFTGCGLSHFVEHMLFQGCRNYPGSAASDMLGKLGGDANAYTSFDRTVYYVELPERNVLAGLEIFAMMLRYPEFPAKRFAAEREVILRESAMGFDNPGRRLGEEARQLVFTRHPLRHPIIGYPELVADVSAETAQTYHARRYTPGRIFFVIAGAVQADAAAEVLNRHLGDWPRAGLLEPPLIPEPLQTAPRRTEFVMPDPLSRLMLGLRVPGVSGAATAAYEIAAGLLGAGDAAHLVRAVQFEQELAVDLDSSFTEAAGESILCISAAAEPGRCRKLESAMFRELDRLRKTGYGAAEVRREKLQHKMETLQELRTNGGIASTVAGTLFTGDSPEAFDRYMDRIDRLSADEVNAVLKHDLLAPDRFCTAMQTPEHAPAKVPATEKTLPEPVRLASGAVYFPNHELPICDFSIILPGGDLFLEPERSGINALSAELLTAGSGRWNEAKIAEKMDALGADLTVSAALNSYSLRVTVARSKWRDFIRFFSTVLAGPDFAEGPFERERRALLAEFAARMQKPEYAARAAVRRMLFGDHPYANHTRMAETLPRLTAADARDFYRSLWSRERTVFAFGGDLKEADAEFAMDILRETLPLRDFTPADPPQPQFPVKAGKKCIPLRREQQFVAVAMPAPACLDERDFPAFQILNDSLNGITGRLYKTVREKHALAYSTGMLLHSGFQPGYVMLHASTAPQHGDQAEKLLIQTVAELAEKGLSEAEFTEARNNEIFAMERIMAQPEENLFEAALNVFYRRDVRDLHRVMEHMKALTRKEVNAVLKRRFTNAVLQCVRTGNLSKEKK